MAASLCVAGAGRAQTPPAYEVYAVRYAALPIARVWIQKDEYDHHVGGSLDTLSNLQAQERMKKLASAPHLIVPGHDPAVFVRFPTSGNGVARIQ